MAAPGAATRNARAVARLKFPTSCRKDAAMITFLIKLVVALVSLVVRISFLLGVVLGRLIVLALPPLVRGAIRLARWIGRSLTQLLAWLSTRRTPPGVTSARTRQLADGWEWHPDKQEISAAGRKRVRRLPKNYW